MSETAIRCSTGDAAADGWLREGVAALRGAFGERLRAVFVVGSRADGTALPSSDLDLIPVLRGEPREEDERSCKEVERALYEGKRIPLDAAPVHDADFAGWSLLPLREGSLLAWGEDLREEVPSPSLARAARWALFAAAHFSRLVREAEGPVAFPLAAPDPLAAFLGYERGTVLGPDGREWPSSRDLVCVVGRAAAALATLQGKVFVPGKGAAFRIYPEVVNDGWSGLVAAVDRRCRREWGYLLPAAVRDRAALRDLCERGLAFENHCLEVHRGHLLEEMRGEDPEGRRVAAEVLAEVVYPGDAEIREGLGGLAASSDEEARRWARKALAAQGGHPHPGR